MLFRSSSYINSSSYYDGSLNNIISNFVKSSSIGVYNGIKWISGYLEVSLGSTMKFTAGALDVSIVASSGTLSGLTDVSIVDVSNNDTIKYNITDGIWKNQPDLWDVSNNAIIIYDASNNLSLSYLEFEQDLGAAILVDMPIVNASSGAEESYSMNIDGNSVLRIYSVADGSGSVINTGAVIDGNYFYMGEPTTSGSWRWGIDS